MAVTNPTAIDDDVFQHVQAVALKHFGLVFSSQKRALVARRLLRAARECGYDSLRSFYEEELLTETASTLQLLANHLSTNHTSFYREHRSFDVFLQEALPEWIAQQERQRDLRVWCAGASTGEEAYTLGLLMMEALGSNYPKWRAGLLATDISGAALKTAVNGEYPEETVALLPAQWQRYFEPEKMGRRRVSDRLLREVHYRRLNLLTTPFPMKKLFHIIFCRNVLIYFSPKQRRETLVRLRDQLEPGGWLMIGAAESVPNDLPGLVRHSSAIYRKA